jgi:hypothetical protein
VASAWRLVAAGADFMRGDDMSKSVFILGAGASKMAGGPLMNEFLDVAESLRDDPDVKADGPHFDLVFKSLSELAFVNAKAVVDVKNLEAVYGAFEMAAMCGRLGDLTQAELGGLGHAMRRVILRTLELRMVLPVRDHNAWAPPPYGRFLTLIEKMKEMKHLSPVSVITLNYDLALDYALYRRHADIDYCLAETPTGGMEVMKLHGSMNWTRCSEGKCRQIVPWHLTEYLKNYGWSEVLMRPDPPKYVTIGVGRRLGELSHCSQATETDPVIVPPTWNKAQYQSLVSVWRRAAKNLSEAENIFVIGYSLPRSDEFFRYLYAIGTYARTLPKRFWVINPSNETENYKALLGPLVSDARVFRYYATSFDESIRTMGDQLTAFLPETEV